MRGAGVGEDHLKRLAGWGAEKLGRLKTNGQLFGYAPLSPLVELEALALGVAGKLALWRTLGAAGAVPVEELAPLVERAEAQRDALERERLALAPHALR